MELWGFDMATYVELPIPVVGLCIAVLLNF